MGEAFGRGRDDLVQMIVTAQADPDWVPGRRAGHLGHAGYLMLDEIVARAGGMTFAEFQQRQVIEPLGLASRSGGTGLDVIDVPWFGSAELADRVGRFDVAKGYPSACVAGPFGQAATVCELLRQGGRWAGRRLLAPETCRVLLADHRPAEMVDQSAGRPRRWGLGVALAAENFRPASGDAFGALGGMACMVFSGPRRQLTAAVHFNGNIGALERLDRDRRVTEALYTDLDAFATESVSRAATN
ncbi:serine hydrolase domain-containing protein [Actinomadura sp. NPDC048394]|uniref:serine hydrolase domain-containing protein n=1 Tax=Actinomadura sp. NPDC048394 TaxID=3158223 RepID=UPI0033FFB357